MAPPESTAIPAAWRTRVSSTESRGVPLDSNLSMKFAAGSTKKMWLNESDAKDTGASSLPGPWPFSPQAPRNSKGGGACGFGAGLTRLPQDARKNTAASAGWGRLHRIGTKIVCDQRQSYAPRLCGHCVKDNSSRSLRRDFAREINLACGAVLRIYPLFGGPMFESSRRFGPRRPHSRRGNGTPGLSSRWILGWAVGR